MSTIKKIVKAAAIAGSVLTLTNANAEIDYNVGIAFGIGHFEFNGDVNDSTFQGDLGGKAPGTLTVNGNRLPVELDFTPQLRTTYKYVGNHPQRNIHIEGGFLKHFQGMTFANRRFFAGANLGLGYGKVSEATGLTNPNANYMSTGSTALFYYLNGKFGLENNFSKLYGILGLTYANVDLPYDILPGVAGTTGLGDLATCTVMREGSRLLQSAGGNLFGKDDPTNNLSPQDIDDIANLILNACSQIKVKDASYGALFANFGAGAEFNVSENTALFVEYVYLMQFNKNKEQKVGYSIGDKSGTFRGKITTTNTQFVKAGMRYHFK